MEKIINILKQLFPLCYLCLEMEQFDVIVTIVDRMMLACEDRGRGGGGGWEGERTVHIHNNRSQPVFHISLISHLIYVFNCVFGAV